MKRGIVEIGGLDRNGNMARFFAADHPVLSRGARKRSNELKLDAEELLLTWRRVALFHFDHCLSLF